MTERKTTEEFIEELEAIMAELPTAADRTLERLNCEFEKRLAQYRYALSQFDNNRLEPAVMFYEARMEGIGSAMATLEEEMDR